MKAALVAVAATAIRCRQYVENQVVGHVGAAAAWEWRILNSLAILAYLEIFLGNALAAGQRAPFADKANGMKTALRSWMVLGTRFFCISASLRRASVQGGLSPALRRGTRGRKGCLE